MMVIALAGVVAVLISTVMSNPLQSFVDQSRRAELVDLAAGALNRMARDVRLAVPNSLVHSGDTIQMLSIANAGRYRANQPDASGARQDPPACSATGLCTIDVLTPITPLSTTTPHWLIIYNTNTTELDDTASPSVISPKAFTWSGGSLSATLPGFRFKYASPQHRFYLANEVVGYRCDGGGRLWRSVSPNLDGSGATESLLVNSVSACSFSYASATNTRSGLLTIRLSLTQDDETITLLQQVHVDNAP
ncbi:type II secretion system protein [Aquipseudomonas campi]|uniref:type II secretion system protein n=1 Tax=Aquipseudomonas campi TaxID=2731681 RepID=UPI0030845182